MFLSASLAVTRMLEQAIQGANVAVNTDASRMGQYVKDFSILMMGYFAR